MNFLRRVVPVTALCFAVAAPRPGEELPGPPPPGRLVDLGGYWLHLHVTGTGPPTVVLIAGAGDFSFDWALVQGEVSRFTSVCSYDRAGSAWSDPGPVPRTMRQEAHELKLLLEKAGLAGPYVLVGHSVGGLIARVYAERYPAEVAGLVLVDPTDEDTTLGYQGRLVRVREMAKDRDVPPVQTMQSSPPRPPTEEDRKQADFIAQSSGPPRIHPPFDRLPPEAQRARLWALAHPELAAASEDFWPEGLQAMHAARLRTRHPLGDLPLVVLVPSADTGQPPADLPLAEWKRISEEKRRQKEGLASLSPDSLLIRAHQGGHHLQLDEPELVAGAIARVVEAVRQGGRLTEER